MRLCKISNRTLDEQLKLTFMIGCQRSGVPERTSELNGDAPPRVAATRHMRDTMRVEGRGRETRIAQRPEVCGVRETSGRNSSSTHDARKAAGLGVYRRVRDLPRLLPLWSQPVLDPDDHFDRDPTRALWLTEKLISALTVEISRHEIAANATAASRAWDEARVGELCLAMAAERLTAAWMIRALAQMAEAQS